MVLVKNHSPGVKLAWYGAQSRGSWFCWTTFTSDSSVCMSFIQGNHASLSCTCAVLFTCEYTHTHTPELTIFVCSLQHGLAQTWKQLTLAAVSKYWKGAETRHKLANNKLYNSRLYYQKCLLTQKVPEKLGLYAATLPRKTSYFLSNKIEAGKLCSKCVTLAEVSLSWRHVEQGEIVHPGNCAVHHGNPQRSWESVERHIKCEGRGRLCVHDKLTTLAL